MNNLLLHVCTGCVVHVDRLQWVRGYVMGSKSKVKFYE